jgi:hypothetical protein
MVEIDYAYLMNWPFGGDVKLLAKTTPWSSADAAPTDLDRSPATKACLENLG